MMVAMTTTRAIQSTIMATLETDKQNMAVKDQDVYWWETFDGNNMKTITLNCSEHRKKICKLQTFSR